VVEVVVAAVMRLIVSVAEISVAAVMVASVAVAAGAAWTAFSVAMVPALARVQVV
jgi:hypothetical protein